MPLESLSKEQQETVQLNIAGENAAIRSGNPDDPDDVNRILQILNSKSFQKYFLHIDGEGPFIPFYYKDAQERIHDDPHKALDTILHTNTVIDGKVKTFARFCVSRSARHADIESGELQGIVAVSADIKYPKFNSDIENTRISKGLPAIKRSLYTNLQISWARLPDANSHQMGSGVRQVLYQIYEKTCTFDEHGPICDVVVQAYIDAENAESINLAKSAGFVYLADDPSGEHVYQVDWNRLLKRLKQPVLSGHSQRAHA